MVQGLHVSRMGTLLHAKRRTDNEFNFGSVIRNENAEVNLSNCSLQRSFFLLLSARSGAVRFAKVLFSQFIRPELGGGYTSGGL